MKALFKRLKKVVYCIVLSLFSSIVYAQPDIDNFVNVFSTIGEFLEALFNSEYAVFGITVISLTVLFYNVFVPLIAKIPVFKGEGNNTANKYVRVVAFCLALLCSLGIFGLIYLNGGASNVREIVDNTLGPFATFAGIALGLLMFGLVYFGFKDLDPSERWKRSMWACGLALVFAGGIIAKPFLHLLGWAIVFIMLIAAWPGKGGGSGGAGGAGGAGGRAAIGRGASRRRGPQRDQRPRLRQGAATACPHLL